MCSVEWLSSVLPAGWLSPGQPSSAGLLRQRPLRLWEHPQGLRLQTAFQVPRLLLPIRERIHFWEVRMSWMTNVAMLRCARQRVNDFYFFSRRWMEVIRSATLSSSGARGLNNKESRPHWFGSPYLGFCPTGPSAFYFYTYVEHLYIWCFF